MGTAENIKLSEIVDRVRSWIPRKMEPANVSRDFWMPDQSCRVCYECDSQFTIFNRRHHCRLCGRVFCAKCTANSIPAPSDEPKNSREDWERIRVCNYCFKQWEQGMATVDAGMSASSPGISPSPSATSLVSTQTSSNSGSSVGSTPYSTGPYQHVSYSSGHGHCQSVQMNPAIVMKDQVTPPQKSESIYIRDPFPDQYGSCNRSDDEDDGYDVYGSHSESTHFSPADPYSNNVDEINRVCRLENSEPNYTNSTLFPDTVEMQRSEGANNILEGADRQNNGIESEASPSSDIDPTDPEPVDFENDNLLWLPPEPENEEDEREAILPDDDDGVDDTSGEWGYLRSSSSSVGGEYRNRDKSIEEHRKAMKNVLDGHFRALIAQLLRIENLPVSEEDTKENWLEIITALSWEAATLLKPDTSKSGGMDPGGYVKIKCLACGLRSESAVVKGVVCKKNVAHRRMTSKIDKPRLLILGGALEYQRVANHLSSFDTLLQQEMDHLKMAVTKIDAHHPNILLVEKSVSRFAQDYLLAKNISLVLNVKRPLLDRIALCTGAQVVPSIDHLTTPKLGYCDAFHVEKFLEEHGTAGHGGKKLIKTLMFFEGCPKPFGCTIVLKGASGDELKKVKHVLQYGVFAAYHLALETSFLADEGASLPELPLKSPIKVVLPDKPPSVDRSISTIPGFSVPVAEKAQGPQTVNEPSRSNSSLLSDTASPSNRLPISDPGSKGSGLESVEETDPSLLNVSKTVHTLSRSRHDVSDCHQEELSSYHASADKIKMAPNESASHIGASGNNNLIIKCPSSLGASEKCVSFSNSNEKLLSPYSSPSVLMTVPGHENNNSHEEVGSKEEFPTTPSHSDHQSILVSLTTRCVLKGTVCERAHLFRIKYYGSFDKPLGRFLQDHLFDQSYRCRSCDLPSEAHIDCYTHQQGSLTISVKKLPDILLPGEREGKIWMWHRCLRCPRTSGFPPSTRRVVMSDAAWGLSFGKFLELSFSNHAAASRVASCGHSLHRDCLRFYGFGRMVACFRYAPIVVNSVYLPPSKLEFHCDSQDWMQKEADEVRTRADLLFDEVFKALRNLLKGFSVENGTKAFELGLLIPELEKMLEKEKEEFEESLWQVLHREVKVGHPTVDILEVNRLKRQLIFHSYIWDQRLIHLHSLGNGNVRGINSLYPKVLEQPACSSEKPPETARPGKGFISFDSILLNGKPDKTFIQGAQAERTSPDGAYKGTDMDHNLIGGKDADIFSFSGASLDEKCYPESETSVKRVLAEGWFPVMDDLTGTLDAAWTGENQLATKDNGYTCPESVHKDTSTISGTSSKAGVAHCSVCQDGTEVPRGPTLALLMKVLANMENSMAWLWVPFSTLPLSLNKSSSNPLQKLGKLSEYNPVYILSFRELLHQGGSRLLLPVGKNDTVVPVYDDEPTSIISYALASPNYHSIMSDEHDKPKDVLESSSSLPVLDSANLLSGNFLDETASESLRSIGSFDEGLFLTSGFRGSPGLDPQLYANALHARVSFQDDGPLGKMKYSVTCYYAKRFEALRRICCPSELDFIRSLSRCKKWGAQGGKSNVFFAKTLDDRFIIKQVTKTELESFIKFAPHYFKYLSNSLVTGGGPTCLAKILGIYQVTSKQLKGGKESKMDVLVMENLLYKRNITRLYDLKGSSRSRYNPDSSGSNKVLLDQNLIETMPTSPIFVGTKAKRQLERAVWNDTSFLASVGVMDYSLLVGIDEEKHELVLGIIDFMRQYTWDKHLESWVKSSGILGGPKNASPTVISPDQYKRRFRKAMSAYFLMVPDQWPPLTIIPSRSQSDLSEENTPSTTPVVKT